MGTEHEVALVEDGGQLMAYKLSRRQKADIRGALWACIDNLIDSTDAVDIHSIRDTDPTGEGFEAAAAYAHSLNNKHFPEAAKS